MDLRITQNLKIVGQVLEFEKQYMQEAKTVLENKYGVPKSDSFSIASRVFKKMCDIQLGWNDYSIEKLWKSFNRLASEDVKHIKKNMSKNFNLTQRSFDELVAQLQNGNEKVFEHLFLSHMSDCIAFLMNKYKISHEVAYDNSMDALVEFRKKLIQKKLTYGNLRFLFTQMASQFYLRSLKKEDKLKNVTSLYDNESNEEDILILEKSLDNLGEACKNILKLNYYEGLNLKEIAQIYSKTPVAMRKQKQRCLALLKSLFQKYNNQ